MILDNDVDIFLIRNLCSKIVFKYYFLFDKMFNFCWLLKIICLMFFVNLSHFFVGLKKKYLSIFFKNHYFIVNYFTHFIFIIKEMHYLLYLYVLEIITTINFIFQFIIYLEII